MRLTRAALRAEAEAVRVDDQENAGASNEPLSPAELKERIPLGQVAGNDQIDSKSMAVGKRTNAKSSRKGKGKKGKGVEEEAAENQQTVILEDERKAGGSPASDAAVEDLGKGANEGRLLVHTPPSTKTRDGWRTDDGYRYCSGSSGRRTSRFISLARSTEDATAIKSRRGSTFEIAVSGTACPSSDGDCGGRASDESRIKGTRKDG